jgi:peptidoglycan/LPS O-acetylase OafA/YrhL
MTVAIAANHYWGWTLANEINPLLSLILASLIFSLAYSFPETAHRLLRRNDISYGTYIYHMPVVNLFVYFGLLHNTRYAWAALTLTIVLAAASWVLIEKPAMALKKHPLNPLGKTRRDQAA